MDDDTRRKDDIIFRSYSEVNNLDRYEDTKAERGLLASSFLILAGATVFGSTLFLTTRLTIDPHLLFAAYVVFFFFILFVSLGTIFVFNAIRPTFNVPKLWSNSNTKGGKETVNSSPKSIYFWSKIKETDQKTWVEYLTKINVDDLFKKSTSDLIYETHLISEKIERKIHNVKIGFFMYMLSAFFLILMTLLLVIFFGQTLL